MTVDRYTKFILTTIAIGIWLLAAAIFFQPTPIQALGEDGDINIAQIGGSSIYGAIPVEIKRVVDVEVDFLEDPVFELQE